MAEAYDRVPWRILLEKGDIARINEHLRSYVRKWLTPFHPPLGTSWDDLHQEALIGVLKAVRDWAGHEPEAFPAFAHLCVTRQVITFLKASTRHKHEVLNRGISLEAPTGDGSENMTVADLLFSDGDDPLRVVIAREEFMRLLARTKRLTEWERECVERHWIAAEPYATIGPQKRVDNALQRASRKLEDGTRDYVPVERELVFLLNRFVYRTESDAQTRARELFPDAMLVKLEKRKLRSGVGDCAPQGRAQPDGRLGVPTWRVTMRRSEVVAAAAA